MAEVEFFFDCSSPWTYLGFHRMQALSAELHQPVRWRPILVGGIFNTNNPSVYQSRQAPVPAKSRYTTKDLADWARLYGIEIRWPQPIFPVNSVKAMRACFHAEAEARLPAFARAVFEAYWGRCLDISQDAVLAEAAGQAGLDPAATLAAAGSDAARAALRANTDELMARGGFGSPTIFVDRQDMYFGNDRLVLVEAALKRPAPPSGA